MSGVRTTRAAILVAQNEDLVVDEIELPGALAPGQVLVELHTSGICGSQLGEIDGRSSLGPIGAEVMDTIFSSFCIGK